MSASAHSFTVRPITPEPQLRRQSSLEHVLSFTLCSPPPDPQDIAEATLLYHRILDHCEAAMIILQRPTAHSNNEQDYNDDDDNFGQDDITVDANEDNDYIPDAASVDCDADSSISTAPPRDGSVPLHKLFRALYQYSPTVDGRVNLVRIVLHGLFSAENHESPTDRALKQILLRARGWLTYTAAEKARVCHTLVTFASDFLDGFFVPLKAQGRCTPSVSTLITPTSRSEPQSAQGTTSRLRNLRALCLSRDGNRCVITGKLDRSHLERRSSRAARLGRPPPTQAGITTEAAHILPHTLNTLSPGADSLHPSKCFIWRVMNMFDPGISNTLAGTLIDTPANALILNSELHARFGRLQCYLESAPARGPNSYTFHTTRGATVLDPFFAPKTRYITFTNHERPGSAKADLPSPRLLALHRACCLMLSMGGAAEYVEALLRDAEDLMAGSVLREDGTSNLALMLKLRGLREDGGEEEMSWMLESKGAVTVLAR